MNNKEFAKKSKKSGLKAYFFELENESPRSKMRKALCDALGVNRTTLYDKINKQRFSALEKERIALIIGEPLSILFPDSI